MGAIISSKSFWKVPETNRELYWETLESFGNWPHYLPDRWKEREEEEVMMRWCEGPGNSPCSKTTDRMTTTIKKKKKKQKNRKQKRKKKSEYKPWKRCEEIGALVSCCDWECQICSAVGYSMEIIVTVSRFLMWSCNHTVGCVPQRTESGDLKICITILRAALLTIAEQPQCPLQICA